MDIVVIILALGAFVMLVLKDLSKFIYYIAAVDILLRIIAYIASIIPIIEVSSFLAKYVPTSASNIISIYSSGIFTTVLNLLLLANYVVFEWYLIKFILKKK